MWLFEQIIFDYMDEVTQRLFQHTFGTHPETFTKRLKMDFFHNWLGGLTGVCSKRVLRQPLKWLSCHSLHYTWLGGKYLYVKGKNRLGDATHSLFSNHPGSGKWSVWREATHLPVATNFQLNHDYGRKWGRMQYFYQNRNQLNQRRIQEVPLET